MSESVYQIITDRIVRLLEQGTVPWNKPWHSSNQAPQNLVSRKQYRGINAFLLGAMGYSSPFWLTFKQAAGLGGHVKKGERGCPVVLWKWLDVEDAVTGETKRIPFLRYYSVFNLSQCENIPAPTVDQPVSQHSPVEAAEQIVADMPKRPDIEKGLDQAFYAPSIDIVGMPAAETFKNNEEYYSVLFHELTHATGHESRLNRKGINGTDGQWSAFGSNPYAKEELVAEMGAAFLCAECGIVDRTLDNSAAYIASWLKRFKDDAKLVVTAAAQAQKAADFILGNHQSGKPETEQT